MTGMAVLHYDNLCIDPNQRRVYVNGRVVEMTTMEFNILYHLASHPGWTFMLCRMFLLLARKASPAGFTRYEKN